MHIQTKLFVVFLSILLASASLHAQTRNPKMLQKIEELRKIKLLDVLDLEGEQVEKFFAIYNKHQHSLIKNRTDIELAAKSINSMLESGAADGKLAQETEALRKAIRDRSKVLEARFDDVKSVLSPKQYAAYVVFETQFQEELQRKIIDRIRERRKQR